jgi:hypothetical protein
MMNSRFAAGLHKLKEVSGKPVPAPMPTIEEAAPAADPIVSELPPSRRGKVAVAAYFDPAVRKQLAILAVKEDRSQAAMLAEALNLLFEKYGEAPIARA